jgi:hypothetical protein
MIQIYEFALALTRPPHNFIPMNLPNSSHVRNLPNESPNIDVEHRFAGIAHCEPSSRTHECKRAHHNSRERKYATIVNRTRCAEIRGAGSHASPSTLA